MECPHCHKEINIRECHHCGESTPLEGRYCINCGIRLDEDLGEVIDEGNGFDLENRILCPDGTCTGIIIDGKCTECGKPFKNTE